MIYKKLLLFFIVMAVVLLGCNSNTNQPASNNTQGKTNDAAADTSSKEKVTVKLWFPGTGVIEEAVNDLIASYETEYPHVTVEYSAIPWAEYFQKLSVGYAGGTGPDIHGLGYGQLIYTVMQGNYLNMNEFIAKDDWDGIGDIYPDVLKTGQWNGGQYGILFPDLRPLVWRKDFFKEAGLDPDKAPSNIEELFEYAELLTVKDDKGTTTRGGIDIHSQNGEQSYLSLLLLEGQDQDIYHENGDPLFDSQVSIDLVSKITKLFDEDVIIPSHQQQLEGSSFKNSLAAMAFENVAAIRPLIEAIGEENIGVALPPAELSDNETTLMLGTFITINNKSKQTEEAWNFLKYWFEPDNLIKFSLKAGLTPPRESLKEAFSAAGKFNHISFEAMLNARGYSPSEHWNLNMKYLRLALEESYTGIRNVEDAMSINANQVRQELNLK